MYVPFCLIVSPFPRVNKNNCIMMSCSEQQSSVPESMVPAQTHYAALGVSENADADDIRRAFRALALLCHPDKKQQQFEQQQRQPQPQRHQTLSTDSLPTQNNHAGAPSAVACDNTDAVFVLVQNAYDVLSAPDSRRAYDADLRLERAAAARAPLLDREVDLDEMRTGVDHIGRAWYETECRCGTVLRVEEDALLAGTNTFQCHACCLCTRILFDIQ